MLNIASHQPMFNAVTISMRGSPIIDVPTAIKISGEINSILLDPAKVDHHFGDSPIFGVVESGRSNAEMMPPPPGGSSTSGGGMPPPLPRLP